MIPIEADTHDGHRIYYRETIARHHGRSVVVEVGTVIADGRTRPYFDLDGFNGQELDLDRLFPVLDAARAVYRQLQP